MTQQERPDADLWIRYLDWSATQIGKRLAELSPDEVWQLAHRSPPPYPMEPLSFPSSDPDLPSHYLDLVRRATLVIADELGLPSFAQWKEAYGRDPDRFDTDILGVRPTQADQIGSSSE